MTGYAEFNNPFGRGCCVTCTTCVEVGVARCVGVEVLRTKPALLSLLHADTNSTSTTSNCPYWRGFMCSFSSLSTKRAGHSYWLRKYAGSLPSFHLMLQPRLGFWTGLMG